MKALEPNHEDGPKVTEIIVGTLRQGGPRTVEIHPQTLLKRLLGSGRFRSAQPTLDLCYEVCTCGFLSYLSPWVQALHFPQVP